MGLLWIPSSLFLSSHISLSRSRLVLELGLVRGRGMEIGVDFGFWIGMDRRRLVGFSVEIGGLPMSPMMGRSRSVMMGWMWCDVGGVDLVALWVKWFHLS